MLPSPLHTQVSQALPSHQSFSSPSSSRGPFLDPYEALNPGCSATSDDGNARAALGLSPTSPGPGFPPPDGQDTPMAAMMTASSTTAIPRFLSTTYFGASTPPVAAASEHPDMEATTIGSSPRQDVPPISGRFAAARVEMTCCCCSFGTGGSTSDRRGLIINDSGRSSAANSAWNAVVVPSFEKEKLDSRTLLLQLPCGHKAHSACLIPIVLEGIGKGDPRLCVCPLDSLPLFPALSRRRCHNRGRRRHPGSLHGLTADDAPRTSSSNRGTPRQLVSTKVTTAVQKVDRHARAAAVREALQRNGGGRMTVGGGSSTEILGITLVGLGLSLAASPIPGGTGQSTTSTANIPREIPHIRKISGAKSRRVLPVPESGPTCRLRHRRHHNLSSKVGSVCDRMGRPIKKDDNQQLGGNRSLREAAPDVNSIYPGIGMVGHAVSIDAEGIRTIGSSGVGAEAVQIISSPVDIAGKKRSSMGGAAGDVGVGCAQR